MKIIDRIIFIVILSAILAAFFGCGYFWRSFNDLEQAAQHGRIQTSSGVYYLTPVVDQQTIDKLARDNEEMGKRLNHKRGR